MFKYSVFFLSQGIVNPGSAMSCLKTSENLHGGFISLETLMVFKHVLTDNTAVSLNVTVMLFPITSDDPVQ